MAAYPFPENVHVTSFVTLKLTDSNYYLWKTQVESLLIIHKLLGFATGQTPAPLRTLELPAENRVQLVENPVYKAWFCTDQLVKSWIFDTLSEEALVGVYSLATACEIWTSLSNKYNKNSVRREFELQRKLHVVKKQGRSFSDYVREYTSICHQLSSIGKPVEESIKIYGFLIGLGREYDPIVVVIQNSMSRLPSPTFSDVVYEIEVFDNRLQTYDASMVSSQMPFNRGSYTPRPEFNRGRGGYSSRGFGLHQQRVTSNLTPLSGPFNSCLTCQICGRVGHIALHCCNRFDNNY